MLLVRGFIVKFIIFLNLMVCNLVKVVAAMLCAASGIMVEAEAAVGT